jgi:hypothetical protein
MKYVRVESTLLWGARVRSEYCERTAHMCTCRFVATRYISKFETSMEGNLPVRLYIASPLMHVYRKADHEHLA